MVSHITKGDKRFGFITEPVKQVISFPDMFTQSVKEVKKLPGTFVPTPKNFKAVNNIQDDIYVLSSYSDTSDSRSVVVMNLKNDDILHKWTFKNPFNNHDRIVNPMMLPDSSLLYAFDCMSGIRRVDAQSNLIWKQDSVKQHHSMNLDADGNIWFCAFEPVYHATGMYQLNGKTVFYVDNYITQLDSATGRIMFHKSMTEILTDNNLEYYITKSDIPKDPIHINDVQPALKTTEYYNKGDLFISARNQSFIMHYRPSTNQIIEIIQGPFSCQHDVDFLNDSTLVFFNNNYYETHSNATMEPPKDSTRLHYAGDFYSNIVQYNLASHSFSFIADSIFRANEIFSNTEGLIELTAPGTFFVEEQNTGLIWILKDDEVIYKNVLKSQHKGHHHLPNWIRILN